jgi:hypothetical protein
MPTAAHEIAALKRAVKEIETRLDALERPEAGATDGSPPADPSRRVSPNRRR